MLALSLVAAPAMAVDAPALVVATYAYPHRDRAASIRPLAEYLGETLQRTIEVRVLASPTALVQAMQDGQVDVAVPNLYGYLLGTREGSPLQALPVPEVPPDHAQRYRSVIVARQPMTMQQLAARARQLRLGLVGRDSASGGFVPLAGLRGVGVDSGDFASVAYAGSHSAALHILGDRQVDVVGLAADEFDNTARGGLYEIWRSPVIPPGPLLCRGSQSTSCDEVAAALLVAGQRDPRVMAGLRAGWPEFGDAQRLVAAPVQALQALQADVVPVR
ncbi:PhnD/SsuA/transferrin family substrate-binding protein [Pseudoxanthomonas indica]|uniref:ABC transporter, phosphonate, substrate-binding protein n=1 Tax=Pseudoxanthomonas indica TaxID=428993 RepID=A0A1T5K379_9GAMM|nr:PhnD/SsuA/transferrin family substrate-binding protein [Pseudoxanthomonas indica]GGD46358.1 hypothetical protein GCM10007235_17900 [Pseudoxanthomonas indica]SKC58156.1 ABC transporter, phosphonate, substrate-binding protein [Pseudoxanthomonas indica]